MIRGLLLLWALPVGLFWGWYFLSLNDVSFGTQFFSRAMHDQVFEIYGAILGIDPAAIPLLAARAIAVDSLFVLALVAFRRRRAIRAWSVARRERAQRADFAGPAAVSAVD